MQLKSRSLGLDQNGNNTAGRKTDRTTMPKDKTSVTECLQQKPEISSICNALEETELFQVGRKV